MKRILVLICACLAVAGLSARDKVKVDFFARFECDRETLYLGDSCLVSMVLYANAPFESVDGVKVPAVKGARCHKRPVRRKQNVVRTRINGRTYYTLVLAQYVVVPEKVGTITLSGQKLSGTFRLYRKTADPFGFFFDMPRSYQSVKADCECKKLEIKVEKKPLRSTEEILRSGGGML